MRVGWGEAEGWTSYIDTSPGAQQWGLFLGYLVLFSEIKLPALSSCGIFAGENKCLDQSTAPLHGGEDEAWENVIPLCLQEQQNLLFGSGV